MAEKKSLEDHLKERQEQFEKEISYHLATLKDAQNNWQVFSGYLGTGKFGEEGKKAYEIAKNDYFGTQNFKKQFDDYNSQREKTNDFLHQPPRRTQNEEVLEYFASSILNSFNKLSQLKPKALDDLLLSLGSKDEKREKFANELQRIREKEIDYYIKNGKKYDYTPEEKKIVDQTEAFSSSAWRTFNKFNSLRAINQYFQSEAQKNNHQIYTESGLKERDEKLEEEKKQEETANIDKK